MARKPWNDEAGKHVLGASASADEIFEPLPEPLGVACPDCNAKPGERCGSIIDASKYFDVPHAARRKLAEATEADHG